MSKPVTVIGAVALALLASPALADEEAGLYFGVGLGDFSSEIDNPDDLDDVDIDFDEDEDATKVFGGFRFNRHVAVQLDWFDFGESEMATDLLNISVDTKGLGPNLVGTLPLGPVELFAKGGVLFYDVTIDRGSDRLLDDSGSDPFYGIGVGFTLLSKLALRVEYEEIDIEQFDDADAAWVTAAWRF
jgi:OOP family OmpA-OmpF porin